MRLPRRLFYSTWGRIFIPLILVGISGVSTNMIAWIITQASTNIVNAVLTTSWTYAFIASSGCLTLYELMRVAKDQNRQEYVNTIMNELTPDIISCCKDMIKQGKVSEAMGNIEITSKMLKPGKAASK